jgi:hypothetical protein
VLCDELCNKRKENINDDMFNNLINIPNRPKEYYKEEWIDWNEFLGLILE